MRRRLWSQAMASLAGLAGLPAWPLTTRAASPRPGPAAEDGAPGSAPGPRPALAAPQPGSPADDGPIDPRRRWRWPRDHGAHPSTAIEWWYLTGWLSPAARDGGPPSRPPPVPTHGFQITFFRSRTGLDGAGRWAPRQLLFAHAAVTTLATPGAPGRHRHAQRVMRWNGDPALPEAHAALDDTRLRLGPWTLRRIDTPMAAGTGWPGGASRYAARLRAPAEGFDLALDLAATQPLLLQGLDGWSRKGPSPRQASCYLTEPQLNVRGQLSVDGRSQAVHGRAWLDHEWSDSLLDPAASGWDWIGINLDDGAALTAFRLRQPDERSVWGGGSWRAPGGATRAFGPDALDWQPLRVWRSPATGIRYPVAWRLSSRGPLEGGIPSDDSGRERVFRRSGDTSSRRPGAWTADGRLQVEVHALLDAQELDSRASTGAIYWEGLVELREPGQGRRLGLGYLEMTGRGERLKLGG